MLPTFIGIGAQRAGTTWAYNCLAEHPEVFMTRQKELHFFYLNYGKGLSWYEEHFAHANGAKARGEITPDYMYHEKALANIARDVPRARVFVILRNPVDRAVSAYALHADRYRGLSFSEATRADPELLDRGFYSRHLEVVYRYIRSEQLKVLFYDDLEASPEVFLADLYSFVGVAPEFRPASLETRYNRVIYPNLQNMLIKGRLGWTIELVKRSPVGRWVRSWHTSPRRSRTGLSGRELRELASLYASDVERLSEMTGRDLSLWLRDLH